MTQEDADRLVRLRARFRNFEAEQVSSMLNRAFSRSTPPDIEALMQAEDFFVYLELRARFAMSLPFRDSVSSLETAVKSWFQVREAQL